MKKKTIVIAGACIGLGLFADQASAGMRSRSNVLVEASYAFGSMASARDSADSSQYIGCYRQRNLGACHAQDPSGAFAMCYTVNPEDLALLAALDSGSDLFFTWDEYGECQTIQVSDYSYHGSKSP